MSETLPEDFDESRLIESGTVDGITWATCEAPLFGAVNGYVLLPEGHPWRGLELQGSDYAKGPDAHGGVTFGPTKEGWIGFDTLHACDYWPGDPYGPALDKKQWDAEMVKVETLRLAEQAKAVLS